MVEIMGRLGGCFQDLDTHLDQDGLVGGVFVVFQEDSEEGRELS